MYARARARASRPQTRSREIRYVRGGSNSSGSSSSERDDHKTARAVGARLSQALRAHRRRRRLLYTCRMMGSATSAP